MPVSVFKKKIQEYDRSAKYLLPVGCQVSVDARRVDIYYVENYKRTSISVTLTYTRTTEWEIVQMAGYQVSDSTVLKYGPGDCNVSLRQSQYWLGPGLAVLTPLSSLEVRAPWLPTTKYPAKHSPSTTWSWLLRLNSIER